MATEYEILVDQGGLRPIRVDIKSDWLTIEDLVDYAGAMMVRESKNDPEVLADLSDYLTITPNALQVVLEIPSDVSSLFAWARGVYDIELQHATDVGRNVRVLQGTITVDREVTR